jgi:adenylate cyclase class 2
MAKEFETQVLEINPKEIAEKLRKLGAVEEPETMQKRWVFDILCLDQKDMEKAEWVRLREKNGKATITYKNKKGIGMSETEEIEFGVNDFEKAAEVLGKLKCFPNKYYQENKRHKFTLGEMEFTLDTWPKLPTFLEIEAPNEEKVHEGLKLLGLEGKEHAHYGLLNIYSKYGINLHAYKEMKFGEEK